MPVNYRFNPLNHYTVEPNGCWRWSGTVSGEGYGRIKRANLNVAAHRFFYEHYVGPIPEGLVLDHLCRNRRCVNPAHLEVVTQAENKMRGVGFAGINAQKLTCPKGHPLDGRYTVHGMPRRRCKECKRQRDVIYKLRTRHPERLPQPPAKESE